MIKLGGIAACIIVMCSLLAMTGRAADDAAAPVKPAVVGRVAVGSQAQIQSLADDLCIPLPAMLTPAGVEQMFTFLGQGGFNPDLPVALDVLAGGDLTQAQRMIFYLPVNQGHAPIEDFLKNNGDKLGDDGAIVGNSPFRRTADYLLFGGTAESIVEIKPDAMVKALADRPLLYLEYDAKKMREVMPDAMEKFKASLPQTAKTPAEQAGQDMVYNAMIDGFDKLVLRLDKKPDVLRLSGEIEPGPKLTQKTWNLPGMPQGLVARLDWQVPDGWTKPGLVWLRKVVGDDEFFNKMGEMTPDKKDKFVELLNDCFEAVLGGDQTSAGVGTSDGEIVGYLVTQSGKARNIQDEWAQLDEKAKEFPNGGDDKSDVKMSQYTTAVGDSVTRFVYSGEDGTAKAQVDIFDRGPMRFETFTKPQVSAMEKLLACPPTGTLNDSASGYVDLEQLVKLLPLIPGSSIKLTDADKTLLNNVLGGQRITFSVAGKVDHLNISTDIPIPLVKNLIAKGSELSEMAQRVSQGTDDK